MEFAHSSHTAEPSGSRPVDPDLARLIDAWPRLHTLSLLGLELGDAVLPSIARRRSLAALDLSSTEVRDPAPLAALPNLRILGLAQTKLTKQGQASVKALAARGIEIVQ